MKKNNWVTVALFDNLPVAESFESFLNEKRIPARTYNDKVLQLILFLCPPRATFRVQVREGFYKMTQELLNKQEPPVLLKAIRCPDCGSLRISYPQMTRKFFLPTLFLHLGIIFRVITHQAYCESCHCIWSLPKKGETGEFTPVAHHPSGGHL